MRRIASIVSLVVLVTACGGAGSGTSANAPAPDAAAPAAAATVPLVKVADSSAGKILVDAKGMTLYRWAKDTDENSQCNDSCATTWPPLLSETATVTGTGVTGKLGTSKRKDGKLQATYGGRPLYFYSRDKAPGDVVGNGSNSFGALWVVIVNP